MLGFKKKDGPTRPFSHATDCKILKTDPGVKIPWQEIETGLDRGVRVREGVPSRAAR
jgi:hypothetical protein